MAQMQSCEELWDLLSAYADGMTTPDEASSVERHTAICPECARDLRFMQETAHVLADVPEVVPPATLRESILAATVYRPTWQQRMREAARRLVPASPLRAMALAGSAAALLLAAYIASTRTGLLPVGGSGTDLASVPNPVPAATSLPKSAVRPPSLVTNAPALPKTQPEAQAAGPNQPVKLPERFAPLSPAPRIVQVTQNKPVVREDASLKRRAELALLSRPDGSRLGIGRRNRTNVAALTPHVNEVVPDLQPERVEQPRESLAGPALDTADMKIPMTASNMEPMTTSREPAGNPMVDPSAAALPVPKSRVTLASLTNHETSAPSSILTLAELRQQLRRQNTDSSMSLHPELRLRSRRDTLDVVKSSF